HSAQGTRCPLYPQKRTWIGTLVMSALCQKQTFRRPLDIIAGAPTSRSVEHAFRSSGHPVYRISTWTFHGEHFYIWLLGWPVYRQRLAMPGRKPIRPGRFVSSLAPFRAVLPTSLPA